MDGMYSLDDGTWFARNYDFSSFRRVVDVGGGSGGLAIGLAEALPHLQVTVAELPLVAKFTRRFVERAGAAGRVQVQAVDIVHQPITGTFDAAILKCILNVMSPEEAAQVLLNVHQALKPGGRIVTLIKPHYEADKSLLRKGVLPDEHVDRVVARVIEELAHVGIRVADVVDSPIRGQGGNREVFGVVNCE